MAPTPPSVSEAERLRASRQLVQALAGALGAQQIETALSWLLLAGDAAWKIKKPVRAGPVDYTTLQRRRFCCEEEVRLNAHLAPGLYLGVQAIAGAPDRPVLGGAGRPIEFAVHMRRFAQSALFSVRAADGTLDAADIDALADLLGPFHAQAAPSPPGSFHGAPALRREAALSALEGARTCMPAAAHRTLRGWLVQEADRLAPLWAQRQAGGAVRECHGDLHLANLLRLPGGVAAFDGVEFDPALRIIDVADDIAFACMDLAAHGRPGFAARLLSRWLDHTGDHGAVAVLRFSAVYRALVRASVAALGVTDRPRGHRYTRTALELTRRRPLRLTVMHGLPGSGKTFVSQQLLERDGAIRIRSDVERKRLFGLPMLASSQAAGLDIYGEDATRRTYGELFARARTALSAGWPVILDAAFLRRAERDQARRLALDCGARFVIAACAAPLPLLRERLLARHGDPSEADVRVLQALAAAAEPLADSELGDVQAGPADGRGR